MITEKDVKIRIAEVLRENGHKVYASEETEGFKRPSFCIDVFPSSITRENACTAYVEMTCNVLYFPMIETTEHLLDIADKMREMFFMKPFDVADRHITVNEMRFTQENVNLSIDFEIAFYDELDVGDTDEDTMGEVGFDLSI